MFFKLIVQPSLQMLKIRMFSTWKLQHVLRCLLQCRMPTQRNSTLHPGPALGFEVPPCARQGCRRQSNSRPKPLPRYWNIEIWKWTMYMFSLEFLHGTSSRLRWLVDGDVGKNGKGWWYAATADVSLRPSFQIHRTQLQHECEIVQMLGSATAGSIFAEHFVHNQMSIVYII